MRESPTSGATVKKKLCLYETIVLSLHPALIAPLGDNWLIFVHQMGYDFGVVNLAGRALSGARRRSRETAAARRILA